MQYDVVIVGGGIVGCATALQILKRDPNLKLALIEKEQDIAQHQTGHNSGVIHAGVYYAPGSLKADFCRRGCELTKQFCKDHHIPFEVTGKLIVATNDKELAWMDALEKRCEQNQLTVTRLTSAEAEARQPGLKALSALFVEESGIVDWRVVCRKYAELAKAMGADFFCGQAVQAIQENDNEVIVKTQRQTFHSAFLITCAGLYSDKLVAMSGQTPEVCIVPFRGEYYQLDEKYNGYFKQLIYPVPDPNMPFLGVHFTPQVSGIVTVGPNAVLALSREAYRWYQIKARELFSILTYPPLWKMLAHHLKAIYNELKGSWSKARYTHLLQVYFPEIKAGDLKPYPAGVRAQAINKAGQLVGDFVFSESTRIIHTCNAPSPAATSSLPIAEYIANKYDDKLQKL